jgi:hypothetical protein
MHRTNYFKTLILLCLIVFTVGTINFVYAAQPTVTLTGSGTVLIGDTRVFVVSDGTPPYTWSIKTVTGAPGILSAYTGETVSFLATVDPGTCYLIVTDNTGSASTTDSLFVVPAPKPIKSIWIQGTSITTQSQATTVITTATTHQVRDILYLVKGGSGTITFSKLDWLTNIAKALNTNVRIHPWVICFSDSAATTLGIYTTVGGSWISPMDPRYRQYLMDSCFIPLARDHQDISGIHLDTYRYPGNAYNYDTGLSLIKFCQEIVTTVRKYNPAIPISIAPMPETSGNEYYYGQSYYKLSTAGCRFFGVMSYTGNYLTSASWVGRVTKYIRDTSARTCAVYAGEQFTYDTGGYMQAAEIAAETKYAVDSGAQGVAAFRWPIQSNQWTAWDTVGKTASFTFTPSGAFSIPIGTDTIISLTGGWKPYARWTTSNWSVGSVSVFYGDDSARFFAVNTGSCIISVLDSAPGPISAISGTAYVATQLTINPSNTFTMLVGGNTSFSVSGGTPPYVGWTTNNWSIGTVSSPNGSSIQFYARNPGTVVISVSDSGAQTISSNTITIVAPLSIIPSSTFNMLLGSNTSFTISGGTPPYTGWTTSNWSVATVSSSSGSSVQVYARSLGTFTVSVSDSGTPTPQTINSGNISIYTLTEAPLFKNLDNSILEEKINYRNNPVKVIKK